MSEATQTVGAHDSNDPVFHTVAGASREVLAGRLSPVDLVEHYLERIAAIDDLIHSFIHVDAEGAREAAQRAAAEIADGQWRGPLHGLPFAVKDNYDTAGLPTTASSRLMLDNVPTTDAAIVERLKAAGAVLLGKLATWEYGTGNGGEYFDLPFPTARNPWDRERFTGGSSTGAAASVAAGTALFAMGSDTTGSVRLPAAGDRHRRHHSDTRPALAFRHPAQLLLVGQSRAVHLDGGRFRHRPRGDRRWHVMGSAQRVGGPARDV